MKRLFASLLLLVSSASFAQSNQVTLQAGSYDAFTPDASGFIGVQYIPLQDTSSFAPVIGVIANNHQTGYAYAGISHDWQFADHWHLINQLAAGYYHHNDSDSLDLGGPLEFRIGLEVRRDIDQNSAIGLGYSHLTNFSIYDNNPGAGLLAVTYAVNF